MARVADLRGRPGAKKKDGSRRWMVMDSSGQEMILDVDKHDIMERTQIHPRDFRVLDPYLSYPSSILRRHTAIILNLEHIKAIITANEVFIRDPLDEDVLLVVEKLRMRLKPCSVSCKHQDDKESCRMSDVEMVDNEEYASPFEFKALEVALEGICSYLVGCKKEFEAALYPALDMLTSKISSQSLDDIRKLKSQMARLCARMQKVRDELQQLLDDDDNMADLCLSKQSINKPAPNSGSNHASYHLASATASSWIFKASNEGTQDFLVDKDDLTELELILEDYFKQIDSSFNRLNTLREFINNTEAFLKIQLDNNRNQLLQVEIYATAVLLCVSIYGDIEGIFTTNIPFTWNNNYPIFAWISLVPLLFSAILFVLLIMFLYKKKYLGST